MCIVVAVESPLVASTIHVIRWWLSLISSSHIVVITVSTLILVVWLTVVSHVAITLILLLVIIQCVHSSAVVHLERWWSLLSTLWLE